MAKCQYSELSDRLRCLNKLEERQLENRLKLIEKENRTTISSINREIKKISNDFDAKQESSIALLNKKRMKMLSDNIHSIFLKQQKLTAICRLNSFNLFTDKHLRTANSLDDDYIRKRSSNDSSTTPYKNKQLSAHARLVKETGDSIKVKNSCVSGEPRGYGLVKSRSDFDLKSLNNINKFKTFLDHDDDDDDDDNDVDYFYNDDFHENENNNSSTPLITPKNKTTTKQTSLPSERKAVLNVKTPISISDFNIGKRLKSKLQKSTSNSNSNKSKTSLDKSVPDYNRSTSSETFYSSMSMGSSMSSENLSRQVSLRNKSIDDTEDKLKFNNNNNNNKNKVKLKYTNDSFRQTIGKNRYENS
jgi:hypothetical protein